MTTLSDLKNRFNTHLVDEGQGKRMQALRDTTYELAKLYLENAPESRELSLAFTNLEQAMFWVNAAIARNEIKQ